VRVARDARAEVEEDLERHTPRLGRVLAAPLARRAARGDHRVVPARRARRAAGRKGYESHARRGDQERPRARDDDDERAGESSADAADRPTPLRNRRSSAMEAGGGAAAGSRAKGEEEWGLAARAGAVT